MELMEAIQQRHSVRQYADEPIAADTLAALQDEIAACNREGGLHIQLVVNEPKAFDSTMAHYGKFSGVKTTWRWWARKAANLTNCAAITASAWC